MTDRDPTSRVIATAPGRVNLIGEHTDYNEGFALPIALDLAATLTFDPDDSTSVRIRSDGHGDAEFGLDVAPGRVSGWAAYVAGVLWALHDSGIRVPGGVAHLTSDVPVGAGLSSSAAIECAAVTAFAAAAGTSLDPIDAARIAQRAENEFVGVPTGLLDQLASMLGHAGRAMLIDFADTSTRTVRFDPEEAGLALVVIDSHTSHSHAGGEYARRRRSCERAAAALGVTSLREVPDHDLDTRLARIDDPVDRRRARHVITENRRVVEAATELRSGDFRSFGALMNDSHRSMRDDFEITTARIDDIADTARAHGAVGARMTGGGFGGSVIALVPNDAVPPLTTALAADAGASGHPEPGVRVAHAGDGARVHH